MSGGLVIVDEMGKSGTKRHRGSRRPITELEQRVVFLLRGRRILQGAIRHLKGRPMWEDVPPEDRPHNSTAIMDLNVRLSDIQRQLADTE